MLLTLLGVVMLPNSIKSEDAAMTERCVVLDSILGITNRNEKEVRNYTNKLFTPETFRKIGDLSVSHKQNYNKSKSELTVTLVYEDVNKNAKATGLVRYSKSSDEARKFLLEKLAMNSLPLELLENRYEVVSGVGDLCIVPRTFDKIKKEFVVDKSQIFFIRGNVCVFLRSNDKDIVTFDLGVEIDKNLTDVAGR